ncbi:SA1362 family protein [Heyndrickxia acidicola]|uniref:SA1362 family protein n=1 Tax=Heyndrickxia acidicola TaxID=209389 RepID=A0ABU6MMG2_9BACI|nr:SA1362 family protein [Heyndrickxia acidicola]MED1205161.1 SA1362 family protein [Heyndrickxia acidicola]
MRSSKWIVGIVSILAIIGLLSSIGTFLKSGLIFILIAAAIYLLYRFAFGNGENKKEQQAFLKAARKSRKRLKKRHADGTVRAHLRKKPIRKKSEVQLTVIEGKKGKKKNRAVF